MDPVKSEELEILISLIKWLMAIVVVCVPLVLSFFVSIRRDTSTIKTDIALQGQAHKHLSESHEELKGSHQDLAKYVYKRN